MVNEKLTCNVLVSLQAKKILSRKHTLSKTLDKKESLLLNTQDILQRIQDAHSDANVSSCTGLFGRRLKYVAKEPAWRLLVDLDQNETKYLQDVIFA